jgi:acetylornithine aminotransferase
MNTFGGHPAGCAVALWNIAIIEEEGLVGRSAQLGADLLGRLREAIGDHPTVGEVRGRGLLIGIGLTEPVALRVVAEAMRGGLIVNAANDSTIRMAPPLTIDGADVDEFAERFTLALDTVAASI